MSIELGDFQVGDQYDLPPSYASKVIGAVMALGGTVVVDGNVVIVTSLPEAYLASNPLPTLVPFAVEPSPAPEPEPAPAPELKLEEAAALIAEYNAEVAAAPSEPDLGGSEPGTAEIGTPVEPEPEPAPEVEAAPEPEVEAAENEGLPPAPVKRGRKPKAAIVAAE